MAASSAATAAAAQPVAPIIHAIGGSLGSALALLFFYPLERARIEMQSQVSAIDEGTDFYSVASSSASSVASSQDGANKDLEAEVNEEPYTPGKSVVMVDGVQQDKETTGSTPGLTSSSSWISFEKDNKDASPKAKTNAVQDPNSPSSSFDSSVSLPYSPTTRQQQLQVRKQLLFSMLSRKSRVFRVLIDLQSRGELYKGMAPVISTIFASQFIFFFMHAYVKRLLLQSTYFFGGNSNGGRSNGNSSLSQTALLSLISSCLAGIGNVFLTNPLWVTNIAIVTGETKTQNLFRELVNIWKTYGTRHLWDGTSASLLLVSNPIIQFFCYEQFKHARLAAKRVNANGASSSSLGAAEAFLIAALSKGIATVTTYPLQLAQTLLRIGNSNDDDESDKEEGADGKAHHVTHHQHYKGTLDCLIQLYKTNKSFAAWFTGMRAKLLQTVLTAAFTFLTYEQILGAVQTVVMLRGQQQTKLQP